MSGGIRDGEKVGKFSFGSKFNVSWWLICGQWDREKTQEWLKIFGLRNWMDSSYTCGNGIHCERDTFLVARTEFYCEHS